MRSEATLPVDPSPITDTGDLVAGLHVEHRFVDTTRLRMHVAEAGSGDALILLHGWPQHWYAWRDVIPLLADRYRVICPDLRGCGWTEAPQGAYGTSTLVDDIAALLDALEIERAFIMGHDIGGRVGFHLSLQAPSRVRRLVTVNAMHPYWSLRRLAPHAWRYAWTVPVETPLLGRLVLRRAPAFVRLLFRLGAGDGRPPTEDNVDEFVRVLQQPGRARAAERLQGDFAYREIIPTLLRRDKQRLTVSTLMLNGTRDFALAPGELGAPTAHADDLRVQLVPGGGHFLPEQTPHLVAQAAALHFASAAGL